MLPFFILFVTTNSQGRNQSMATQTETPIDVSKESIIRLLNQGRKSLIHENEHGVACFWSGYCRALETVLEMEHE